MKVALTTLGCKLNYAETSTYERGFVAHGLEVVPWSAEADLYVINTCAVTETAEKKSRNLMRRAHKRNPDGLIVVTGCYAELKKEKLYEIEGVTRVFAAAEKPRLVDESLELLSSSSTSVFEDEKARQASSSSNKAILEDETLPAYSSGERTRSFLKVQDGCNNFCAYCTVPYARGRSRNIPICELVKQAEQIAAKGIREVVLTGVNTGDFGRTTGESFLDLPEPSSSGISTSRSSPAATPCSRKSAAGMTRPCSLPASTISVRRWSAPGNRRSSSASMSSWACRVRRRNCSWRRLTS